MSILMGPDSNYAVWPFKGRKSDPLMLSKEEIKANPDHGKIDFTPVGIFLHEFFKGGKWEEARTSHFSLSDYDGTHRYNSSMSTPDGFQYNYNMSMPDGFEYKGIVPKNEFGKLSYSQAVRMALSDVISDITNKGYEIEWAKLEDIQKEHGEDCYGIDIKGTKKIVLPYDLVDRRPDAVFSASCHEYAAKYVAENGGDHDVDHPKIYRMGLDLEKQFMKQYGFYL